MIGKTLAHYEITALLGRGGMGEVYRAHDTKLRRDVALKILPRELSGDLERTARFEREARTLASLQHPHVASIYGFEDTGEVRFLVMELVEGENLAQRLEHGRPPLEEVERIARQMAAGLEAAHDKGIIHRDLKPANVMLDDEGNAKILDFGLARAWFGDPADESNLANSPTITAGMTQAGTILGTAAYMSPEQARGRNVDRRADIWAFGVILWELLTGERLFEGETISDTLAAVLRAEPDWSRLPADEAPVLCHLVERCLVRDPRQRLRDVGEARLLLEGGSASASGLSMPAMGVGPAPSDAPALRRGRLLLGLAGLAGLLLGVSLAWFGLRAVGPTEVPVLHLMIPPPPGTEFALASTSPGPAVLSPDGRWVTFTAVDAGGIARLYLRQLDREEAVPMPGTEDAAYPFWSPDSAFIGFFTPNGQEKLSKVAVAGGPPITLCPAPNGKGGSWNEEGTILFAPSHDTGIARVAAIGGEPAFVTELAEGDDSHRHPRFLPDGRHFLYLARTAESARMHEIRVASLDGGESHTVTMSECQAEVSAGHLLSAREGILLATPFDLRSFETVGGGFPIVDRLLVISSGAAAASYSVSATGMITYQTGRSQSERILQWTDLDDGGRTTLPISGSLAHPKLSPDGRYAMIEVGEDSEEDDDLWLVDLEAGLRTRFTFDSGSERAVVWSPDSRFVVYTTGEEESSRLMRQEIGGTAGAEVVFENAEVQVWAMSIDSTGQRLYLDRDEGESGDIVWMDLRDPSELHPLRATEVDEGGAVISPDGSWIAYHESSANGWDVFVMPADGGPRKWQMSTSGAVWPRWSPDGSVLYAIGFNGGIIGFPIERSGDRPVVGSPRKVATILSPDAGGSNFDIDPRGKRFLSVVDDPTMKEDTSFVHLVTDWRRGLGR